MAVAVVVTGRPRLAAPSVDAAEVAEQFAAGLQAGHDRHDAEILNRQFAADVAWGSPFGALIDGYERLHPIHAGFQRRAQGAPSVRYEVRHVLAVSEEVVIAHIARLVLDADAGDDGNGEPVTPSRDPDGPFSELAMYVLVRRDGQWWLAAGQNTPMRAGGAVPAT